jgi:hypothetical protein
VVVEELSLKGSGSRPIYGDRISLAINQCLRTATDSDLMGLHCSRRYAREGVRKIPFYDELDAVEPPEGPLVLVITGYRPASELFSILGAGPCSLRDEFQLQSK